MRHGELLAESPPEMLITKYGVESLEDVFLCLCNKQSHEEEIVTDPDLDKVRWYFWTETILLKKDDTFELRLLILLNDSFEPKRYF